MRLEPDDDPGCRAADQVDGGGYDGELSAGVCGGGAKIDKMQGFTSIHSDYGSASCWEMKWMLYFHRRIQLEYCNFDDEVFL